MHSDKSLLLLSGCVGLLSVQVVLKNSVPQVIRDISYSTSGSTSFPLDNIFANGDLVVVYLAVVSSGGYKRHHLRVMRRRRRRRERETGE